MHGEVKLFELAFQVAGDGRVADVGVHFAAGGDADAHRLQPARQVHLVRRNDHSPGGHFASNGLGIQPFPLGDKSHFRRRFTCAGTLQLCDRFGHGG